MKKELGNENEIICGCGRVYTLWQYNWHIKMYGEINPCGCRKCDYCDKLCGDGESEDVSEQPAEQAYKCRECATPQIPEVWIMSDREVVTLQLVAHNLQVDFDIKNTHECEIKLICQVGLAHHIGGGIPEVLTGILKGMFGDDTLQSVKDENTFRYSMDLVTKDGWTYYYPSFKGEHN